MARRQLILETVAHTEQAQRQLGRLAIFVGRFADTLKLGFGVDIARRLNDAFIQIARSIERAAAAGVKFNQLLEDATIGIASVLQSTAPGAFQTFEDAMHAASRFLQRLQVEAQKTSATFEDLVSIASGVIGPAMQAGIPLERIPEVLRMISQAVTAIRPQAPGWQIWQEARALLTGDITQHADIARALGITRQEVLAAQQQGRMYEWLVSRLHAFNEAADRARTTLSYLTSNLRDYFQQTVARATTDLTDVVKRFIQLLYDFIGSDTFRRTFALISQIAKDTLPALKAILIGIVWIVDKLVKGLQLLWAGIAGLIKSIGTAIDWLVGTGDLTEALSRGLDEYKQAIADVLDFEKNEYIKQLQQTTTQQEQKTVAGGGDAVAENIRQQLQQYAKSINDEWRRLMGYFEHRVAARIEHGLGYTFGAIGMQRQVENIQRSMLDVLRGIYQQLQSGVAVKLDSLEL